MAICIVPEKRKLVHRENREVKVDRVEVSEVDNHPKQAQLASRRAGTLLSTFSTQLSGPPGQLGPFAKIRGFLISILASSRKNAWPFD
jgi:hypothetical protein